MSTVEKYDPVTNSWSSVAPIRYTRDCLNIYLKFITYNYLLYVGHDITSQASSHVAAAVLNNHMYAISFDIFLDSKRLERYDPHVNAWTQVII